MKRFWNFIKDEDGLETPEYALMGALILLAAIVTIKALGGAINTTFQTIADTMSAEASS
jgi:Flp pilus assembly pilin Flp